MRKGLRRGEVLFSIARKRVESAVGALPDVDLISVPPAAQSGRDFGERLEGAFHEAARRGYREIIAVPGDVPGLVSADLHAAFRALSEAETVLGPSRDGGVWLIGIRACPASAGALLARLFEGVRWLTARVRGDLRTNAPGAVLLDELTDVDRPADAARLRGAVRAAGGDAALLSALDDVLGCGRLPRLEQPRAERRFPFHAIPPGRAPPLSAF